MSEEITISQQTAAKPSKLFAYASVAVLGTPALLFMGLATAHFLASNYDFVYRYGNRGLGMVVSASFALLMLQIILTLKRANTLRNQTRNAVESAQQQNLVIPADLVKSNPLINAFRNQPLTVAAWLPALVVGAFIYITALTNFSIQRLQSSLTLANSGAHDQLVIEALYTFAALLTANIIVGLTWAKVWRKKLSIHRTALLSLQEQISHASLAAAEEP